MSIPGAAVFDEPKSEAETVQPYCGPREPLEVGGRVLPSRYFLAPLAGYTNLALRLTIRELGGLGLATSDLVNARALLEGRRKGADNSGNTSLVKQLGGVKDDAVDLDLADLTAALHGADTVEQPRSFSRDVFGTGSTPLDLDVGNGLAAEDDDPTGTAEQALDPQTMTEVGTKLDLARAYIDMGDPEGARSILQEVLDEGDSNQRREAQGLIDALHA